MEYTELLLAQLRDPFRVGLMIALVLTMLRTRAVSGTALPLAAGVVFVAVIIPMTLPAPAAGGGMLAAVGTGIVANLILLGLILGAWTLWQRLRR
ncbi:hypothetical protein [Gemmobacter sp.]|uniref:hypothetical protein n=1 Tax=Gemmobacter sp. TaxID=1898957 RepID=UPI002AFFAA5E|nr:hypothetical protein [Gemmobacter sp.]